MRKPKILIDANPIVPELVSGKVNGIGRTCRELIMGLDAVRDELPFDIRLYTQNVRGVSALRLGTGFKTVHSYIRNTTTCNKWAKRLRLREILGNYDLMHITHNYENVTDPSKCVVTVHDVMFYSYPEPQVRPEANRMLIPPFIRKCKHVITISANSKREIMEYMDVPEEKITVIPWGVNHDILKPHIVEKNPWCGDNPYFASISCDTGRKNTISLVRAFERFALNNPKHHLLLVWRNPSAEVIEISTKPALKDRIHFASNVDDMTLSDIYAGATATFFPSLYEGFGLPVAESMACGTPCVTARNSSLEEVGGEAALYVEPLDIDAMANVMGRFENGEYQIAQLKEASLRQAAKFTWRNCASRTIDVYKQCLGI